MRLLLIRPLILMVTLVLAAALPPAMAGPFDELKVENTAAFANFEKVYIAPVGVELDEENVRRNVRDIRSDRPVSEKDRTRRAERSHADLTRALSKHFEIVDAPGADVLTVEATITRIVSTRPTLEDQRVVSIQLSFSSIYAGGGDFKVRLLQGDTIHAELEDSYRTNLNDGRPRVGIWQDYDRSSRQFARKLARYLDKL